MSRIRLLLFALFLILCSLPILSGNPEDSTDSVADLISVPGRIDPAIPKLHEHPSITRTIRGYPWHMRPEIFGFTDPPKSERIWYPGDFAYTGGILLGWPLYAFDARGKLVITELRDIVLNSVGRTQVFIIASPETRVLIENLLHHSDVDPGLIEFVSLERKFPDNPIINTLDTVWIRDYGPQFVFESQNHRPLIMDMSYYPFLWISRRQPLGRVLDDAIPGRLAETWGLTSIRPPLVAEGGELLTDGRSTCFVSEGLVRTNQMYLDASYDPRKILKRYFGCRRIIVLKGLVGEDTGHIDLFMTALSNTTILVGQYDPSHDPVNARRLDLNAQKLKEAGYYVRRIPMPRPYSIEGTRVWATFTNALRLPEAVLVPVFRNRHFPEALRKTIKLQEIQALQEFQKSMPRTSIIPVVADPLIPFGGSLHCIAINVPARYAGQNSHRDSKIRIQ